MHKIKVFKTATNNAKSIYLKNEVFRQEVSHFFIEKNSLPLKTSIGGIKMLGYILAFCAGVIFGAFCMAACALAGKCDDELEEMQGGNKNDYQD